jgi:pyruvate kinase
VSAANRSSKPVIVATQMLESMTENALPTRAEVTDVANAVLDGADATMLSGETAVGRYPVESVARMSKISEATERELYPFGASPTPLRAIDDFAAAAAHLAASAANDIGPKAIVAFTQSGRTPMLISDERPRAPIAAFATEQATRNMLALHWGVVPLPIEKISDVHAAIETAERELVTRGLAAKNDSLVLAFGAETGSASSTSVRITRLGART